MTSSPGRPSARAARRCSSTSRRRGDHLRDLGPVGPRRSLIGLRTVGSPTDLVVGDEERFQCPWECAVHSGSAAPPGRTRRRSAPCPPARPVPTTRSAARLRSSRSPPAGRARRCTVSTVVGLADERDPDEATTAVGARLGSPRVVEKARCSCGVRVYGTAPERSGSARWHRRQAVSGARPCWAHSKAIGATRTSSPRSVRRSRS